MKTSDLNTDYFETVNRQVLDYIQHPFLVARQIHQSLSRFHFDVAWAILQGANTPFVKAEPVLQALLLLHQGLAIHEDVDEFSDVTRQLAVLAGDYDSSRYYWVLARAGDPSLMNDLCEAVVRINESKIELFRHPSPVSFETYMKHQMVIHGQLLFSLAAHFEPSADYWTHHVKSLVQAYVFKRELQRPRFKPPRFRQVYEWATDALDKFVKDSAVLHEPLSACVRDYLTSLKTMLEGHAFAEGNRG